MYLGDVAFDCDWSAHAQKGDSKHDKPPEPAALQRCCRHGHRLVASGPLLGRLLRAAVGFLDEGGLEARTSGKRILWEVRGLSRQKLS